MHINFQNDINSNANDKIENVRHSRVMDAYGKNRASAGAASGIVMDIGGDHGAAYGFKGVEGARKKGKNKDISEDIASFDAKNAHNYMAVMSNTMSPRDFQKMREEGFHPGRMSEAEAVTNLDRIKVILSEAGVQVAGFTDTVDRETAAEITGSEAAAGRITENTPADPELLKDEEALKDFIGNGFRMADLPATKENMDGALEAFDMASRITPPDQGAVEYMLSNAEEPTIGNLYMAEHSGGKGSSGGSGGYFKTEGGEYFAEAAENDDLGSIASQIDALIEESGFEVNDEMRQDAGYLIRSGFALNKETLTLYEDIKDIGFPLKAGDIMKEITEAVAEGRDAASAYLIRDYNRIKNERILNETRLVMNAETNRSLSSNNGFSLETEELSEKVELLKEKERLFYRAAFSGGSESSGISVEEKMALAEETVSKLEEIKNMPAALAGRFASAEAFTVNDVYEAGNEYKLKFEAANATYEAVGTEVRADLGDRIGNAFKSAAGLLKEIAFEETADNLRAVRILGYNGMEITAGNITRVKAADQTIRTLVERLTGAATVSLIREGINPLETGAQELIDRITKMEGMDESNEKFSEYLFRLERNNAISDDEAASYIGVYRLIRQLENSDGAAIGALVNNGRDLSLKNLLSELRTRNKGHMDYKVDDGFGGIISGEGSGDNLKIDTQIETAFRKEPGEEEKGQDNNKDSERKYAQNVIHEIYDRMDPESLSRLKGITGDTGIYDILDVLRSSGEKESNDTDIRYIEEMTEEIREAAGKGEEVYETLLNYDLEITAENVNAMDALMYDRGMLFRQLMGLSKKDISGRLQEHSEKMLEKMNEAGEDISGSLSDEYAAMAEELRGSVMNGGDFAEKYIDLKMLQNLNRQLTVATALSKEENYEVPMEIEGRLTSVNIKVVRGTGESRASVSFETESYGKVYGEFSLTGEKIRGFVSSSTDSGTALLKSISGSFFENMENAGIEKDNIIFEKTLNPDINRIPKPADIIVRDSKNILKTAGSRTGSAEEKAETEGKDAAGNTALLYRTVSSFISAVR